MAISTSVKLGRMLGKVAKFTWRHRKKVVVIAQLTKETAETIGPHIQKTGRFLAEKVSLKYKICRVDEKRVIDYPLAEKFVIARRGERCYHCKLKVDAFGNPIPGTEPR